MIEIIDLDGCELSRKGYDGNAGKKFGVLYDGAVWLVKFPESTRNMPHPSRFGSYTTSPLSEYLGSKAYEVMGVPVHETRLGVRDGKLVVACRDFVPFGRVLNSFHSHKNMYVDKQDVDGSLSSTPGSFPGFDEAVEVVYRSQLARVPGVIERFWDMFVIDALIGNADRNNSNWGTLLLSEREEVLAPVFDNGNAFTNKKTLDGIRVSLTDAAALLNEAISEVRSRYEADDKQIFPFGFMRKMLIAPEAPFWKADLVAALERACARWDQVRFDEVVDGIPDQARGIDVVAPEQRAYYKALTRLRASELADLAAVAAGKSPAVAFAQHRRDVLESPAYREWFASFAR